MSYAHWTLIAAIMLIAGVASGVDFGQRDGEAVAGAVAGSSILDLAPGWLAALVPPLVITTCSILNAVFKDGQMGRIAPIINKAALAVGKAKTDQATQ